MGNGIRMRRSTEKAFAVSAAGHMLVLVMVFQAGQWRPIQRGYPRTISAVLVPKGAKGSAQSAASSAPAGASVAAPQPPTEKKAEPRPAVAKERSDKNTSPAVSAKKAPGAAQKKNSDKEKPRSNDASPSASASSNTATKAGGGKIGAGSGTGSKALSGGVARVDGPEFPFPHYIALLQFRIENQWQPAYLGSGQFLATVHFIIAKSGKILSAEIEQPSGNFAFDQAALRAVHNSNPLPALPEGLGMETLGVHFDFVANW